MPWCPKCREEYREGISQCNECGAALIDKLHPIEKIHINYCKEAYVITVPDITCADVVESLLNSYGIPTCRIYREAGDYLSTIYRMTNFGIDIFVPDKSYQEAIEILHAEYEDEFLMSFDLENEYDYKEELKKWYKRYQPMRIMLVLLLFLF